MGSSEGLKPEGSQDNLEGKKTPKKTSFTTNLPNLKVSSDPTEIKSEKPFKSSAPDISNNQEVITTEKATIREQEALLNPNIDAEQGGEWQLLQSKVKQWWDKASSSETSIKPFQIILPLLTIGVLAIWIQVYGRLLGAIELIPLAPRMFQLAGTFWLATFFLSKLARAKTREELFAAFKKFLLRFKNTEN